MLFFGKNTVKTSRAPVVRGRVPIQEKINFARHLAIMVKAGLPLFESLKILRRQTTSKKFQIIIDQVILDVNNGQSMASSLRRFHRIFGDFFISIVEVGERSGTLGPNLLYLAEELKKAKDLRGKVRSAMVYPAILFIMTVGVSGFLTFFVFPKLLPTFANFDVELPVATRVLIAILGFLSAYWWLAIIIIVGLVATWRFLMRLPKMKLLFDRFVLVIPVISTLSIYVNTTNMARILSILLRSGIKIVESILIVSNTFENKVYEEALKEAAEEIKKGGAFSEYLMKKKKIFPPILSAMIEVGENTGNLEENLSYLANYYSEEVDTSLKNVTVLLEPLILLIMGIVVGFVALSIITPIYTISQGISQ
ncbi:MAG: type II secretion system F family protein [Patescibacteria group bacterium]